MRLEQNLINLGIESVDDLVSRLTDSTNLESLIVHGNRLTTLVSRFVLKLPKLKSLNLSSNELSFVDFGDLQGCPELRNIDLAANQIAGMRNLAALKNIENLNMSFNCLTDLKWLQTLPLPVSDAKTADSESLASLSKISKLDMLDNRIFDINDLYNLRYLPSLKSLRFQQARFSKTAGRNNEPFVAENCNPICNHPSYLSTILAACPSLELLDDVPVSKWREILGTPASRSSSPNLTIPPYQPNSYVVNAPFGDKNSGVRNENVVSSSGFPFSRQFQGQIIHSDADDSLDDSFVTRTSPGRKSMKSSGTVSSQKRSTSNPKSKSKLSLDAEAIANAAAAAVDAAWVKALNTSLSEAFSKPQSRRTSDVGIGPDVSDLNTTADSAINPFYSEGNISFDEKSASASSVVDEKESGKAKHIVIDEIPPPPPSSSLPDVMKSSNRPPLPLSSVSVVGKSAPVGILKKNEPVVVSKPESRSRGSSISSIRSVSSGELESTHPLREAPTTEVPAAAPSSPLKPAEVKEIKEEVSASVHSPLRRTDSMSSKINEELVHKLQAELASLRLELQSRPTAEFVEQLRQKSVTLSEEVLSLTRKGEQQTQYTAELETRSLLQRRELEAARASEARALERLSHTEQKLDERETVADARMRTLEERLESKSRELSALSLELAAKQEQLVAERAQLAAERARADAATAAAASVNDQLSTSFNGISARTRTLEAELQAQAQRLAHAERAAEEAQRQLHEERKVNEQMREDARAENRRLERAHAEELRALDVRERASRKAAEEELRVVAADAAARVDSAVLRCEQLETIARSLQDMNAELVSSLERERALRAKEVADQAALLEQERMERKKDAEASARSLELQKGALLKELHEKDAELTHLQLSFSEQKSASQRVSEELQKALAALEASKAALKDAQTELQVKTIQLRDAQDSLRTRGNDIAALRASLEAEKRSLATQADDLRTRVTQLEGDRADLREQLQDVLASLEEKESALESESSRAASLAERLETTLATLEEMQQLLSANEDRADLSALRQELEDKTAAVTRLSESLTQAEERVSGLEEMEQDLRSDLSMNEGIIQRLESERKALQEALESSDMKAKAMEAELTVLLHELDSTRTKYNEQQSKIQALMGGLQDIQGSSTMNRMAPIYHPMPPMMFPHPYAGMGYPYPQPTYSTM